MSNNDFRWNLGLVAWSVIVWTPYDFSRKSRELISSVNSGEYCIFIIRSHSTNHFFFFFFFFAISALLTWCYDYLTIDFRTAGVKSWAKGWLLWLWCSWYYFPPLQHWVRIFFYYFCFNLIQSRHKAFETEIGHVVVWKKGKGADALSIPKEYAWLKNRAINFIYQCLLINNR